MRDNDIYQNVENSVNLRRTHFPLIKKSLWKKVIIFPQSDFVSYSTYFDFFCVVCHPVAGIFFIHGPLRSFTFFVTIKLASCMEWQCFTVLVTDSAHCNYFPTAVFIVANICWENQPLQRKSIGNLSQVIPRPPIGCITATQHCKLLSSYLLLFF